MQLVKKAFLSLILLGFCPFMAYGMAHPLQTHQGSKEQTVAISYGTALAGMVGLHAYRYATTGNFSGVKTAVGTLLLGSTAYDCLEAVKQARKSKILKFEEENKNNYLGLKKLCMISDRLVHWIAFYTSMGLAYGFKTQYPLLYTLAGTAVIGIPMKCITTLLQKYKIPELPGPINYSIKKSE